MLLITWLPIFSIGTRINKSKQIFEERPEYKAQRDPLYKRTKTDHVTSRDVNRWGFFMFSFPCFIFLTLRVS